MAEDIPFSVGHYVWPVQVLFGAAGRSCRRLAVRGLAAVLFTTHIDIAAFAQDKQGHTGKRDKTHNQFPHRISFKKKAPPTESLQNPPDP